MKRILIVLALAMMIGGCCKEEAIESSQQITYRLVVQDIGYKMWYHMEDYTDSVYGPGVYDTTMTKYIGDTLYFRVQGTCAEDQRQSFNMQILRNGYEVKSKSLSIKNVCHSFDYEMKMILAL